MNIQKVVETRYVDKDDGFEFVFMPIEESLKVEQTATGFEARYLTPDDCGENPDSWGDDNLFLVAFHRDFTVKRDELIDIELCRNLNESEDALEDYELQAVKEWESKYYSFGLEAYIHSGVTLALSHEGNFPDRRWDVSQLGMVFVAKEEWPDRDKAREAALGLIKEWNQYLSGEVYMIVKETYDQNKIQLDYDCVGGFYGYEDALNAMAEL